MNAIIKAEAHQHSAYLTTGNGEVWRVFYQGKDFPLMERLTDDQIREFEGLQQRAARHARERIAWTIREKKQGFDIPQDLALEMADAILGPVAADAGKDHHDALARFDGVLCPDDSCDIETGVRSLPTAVTSTDGGGK